VIDKENQAKVRLLQHRPYSRPIYSSSNDHALIMMINKFRMINGRALMNLGCRYLDNVTTKSVASNIRYDMCVLWCSHNIRSKLVV